MVISASNLQISRPWRGWGTSLAWFGNFIGGLPPDQLNELLDLLFDPFLGLGLNIVRYNIGGGHNPRFSPQFSTSFILSMRGMPGYKADANSPYNWTADWRQFSVLIGAYNRGVDTIIAFSNSPPWYMTYSKDVAGRDNTGKTSNLPPANYEQFAVYLADVVKWLSVDQGLPVVSLEPFNEPFEGFWKKGGKQEGCIFNANEIAAAVPYFRKALNERGLSDIELVLFDSGVGYTPSNIDKVPASILTDVKEFHVHGYTWGKDKQLDSTIVNVNARMQKKASQTGKEVWVSEWGPAACLGTTDLDSAFCVAKGIMINTNILQARAWVFWQAIDSNFWWTLINMTWAYGQPLSYTFSKKYHALKQYTDSVRPGSYLVKISASQTCLNVMVSFYDPSAYVLSIFAVNTATVDSVISMSVDGFGLRDTSTGTELTRCRTSASEDNACVVLDTRQSPGTVFAVFKGRSITKLTFDNLVPN